MAACALMLLATNFTAEVFVQDPMAAGQWGLSAIGAQQLWAKGIVGSRNVRVCHLDTGADRTNLNLIPNLVKAGGGDNVLLAPSTSNDQDDNGHGTAVAGVIGAADNGFGVSGVAPLVTILPCKFMDASGSGFMSGILPCLEFCKSKNAHIVHGSFGESTDTPGLREAVAAMEANGTLFVFSAGNDGMDTDKFPHYPSGYSVALDNVLSVAAVDQFDNSVWMGSNYGAKSVQMAAPHNVMTLGFNNVLLTVAGTSIAAPHVTGGAVLLFAYLESLGISISVPNRHRTSMVRAAMRQSTHQVGEGPGPIGGGMLYLPSALKLLRAAVSKDEL